MVAEVEESLILELHEMQCGNFQFIWLPDYPSDQSAATLLPLFPLQVSYKYTQFSCINNSNDLIQSVEVDSSFNIHLLMW